MSHRWIDKEAIALAEVKRRLKNEIQARPQYPDVVGDRRIIRFLRGKQNDVNETVKMFSGFLKWRDENKVDDIRNQILYGGLDTPFKFPNGKKIIDLAPQIIISAKAKDFKGQPLVLEQYSFSPGEMFSRVTIADYLLFLIYALEYRALVMEQLSHEEEIKYLEDNPNPDNRADGYGVVLLNFCIRDLHGVGLAHLTGKGKAIIEAAINIGLPNYPEYLGKCHMVNVPWLFTSMWFFIKGLLDEFILAKINLTGSKFMDTLLKDMPLESVPKALGGKFELYNESYAFDTSITGPFHCENAPMRAPTLHIRQPSESLNGETFGEDEGEGEEETKSCENNPAISRLVSSRLSYGTAGITEPSNSPNMAYSSTTLDQMETGKKEHLQNNDTDNNTSGERNHNDQCHGNNSTSERIFLPRFGKVIYTGDVVRKRLHRSATTKSEYHIDTCEGRFDVNSIASRSQIDLSHRENSLFTNDILYAPNVTSTPRKKKQPMSEFEALREYFGSSLSQVFLGGFILYLTISNPRAAFQYILVPFLFGLTFVYVL